MSVEFQARYPGRCATGDDDITPGDRVTYTVARELRHVDCPDPFEPVTRPAARRPRFEGVDLDALGY